MDAYTCISNIQLVHTHMHTYMYIDTNLYILWIDVCIYKCKLLKSVFWSVMNWSHQAPLWQHEKIFGTLTADTTVHCPSDGTRHPSIDYSPSFIHPSFGQEGGRHAVAHHCSVAVSQWASLEQQAFMSLTGANLTHFPPHSPRRHFPGPKYNMDHPAKSCPLLPWYDCIACPGRHSLSALLAACGPAVILIGMTVEAVGSSYGNMHFAAHTMNIYTLQGAAHKLSPQGASIVDTRPSCRWASSYNLTEGLEKPPHALC